MIFPLSHHHRLIAHRGNLDGPNPEKENHPDYIHTAVKEGYEVEVDLWKVDNNLYLGHDSPQYRINEKYLNLVASAGFLWTHAKNIEALHRMLEEPAIHCFWHENDLVTLTSKGYVWKYPEVYFQGKLWGVCSDWV